MANKKCLDYHTFCADNNDEIEGLNEKLLQLLAAKKGSSSATSANKSQSLCDGSRLNNNNASKVESETSASPLFSHYRYDYSFLHHDSPVNMPTLPSHLPPIGVFWDIENCQVSLIIFLVAFLYIHTWRNHFYY